MQGEMITTFLTKKPLLTPYKAGSEYGLCFSAFVALYPRHGLNEDFIEKNIDYRKRLCKRNR
jgi:hypothetical protein